MNARTRLRPSRIQYVPTPGNESKIVPEVQFGKLDGDSYYRGSDIVPRKVSDYQ